MKCQEDFLLTVINPVFPISLTWSLQQVINTTHSETPISNSFNSPVPSGTGQFLASGTQSYTWPTPINIRIRVKVNANTGASPRHSAISNFFDNGSPDITEFQNGNILYHYNTGGQITQTAGAGAIKDIFYTFPAGTHLLRFDIEVFIFSVGVQALDITYSVI